jgi:hypothetical protein
MKLSHARDCRRACIACVLALLADVGAGRADEAGLKESLQESSAAAPPATTKNFLGLDAEPLDGPLVSDRPDFTESALSVPYGHMQLESGYTFTYDREDGVRVQDHVFPELLARIGIVKDWELRIGWLGGSLTETLSPFVTRAGRHVNVKDHDDGATDMTAGFKVHLWEQKGLLPEFGVIGELSLPTGARSKTSADVDPQVKLLWAYELTEKMALSGNINLAVPTGELGRFFQTAASVSLGYSFTDWLGGYIEYFGFYPAERDQDCAHTLNGGLTFPITDNLQFDVRSGFGLNEQADDFFVGSGFVIRY